MLDESISTFLPSWLVKLDSPPSSRDPLGLQARAMEQADGLLPGLNVFTSRARYYTFLCWALDRAQAAESKRTHLERVLRLERLLVLCEALKHEDDPKRCSYIGRRRGRRFVSERRGAGLWELPTKILKNQPSSGALRLYRTSLASLGLIEEDDFDDGLGLHLTDRGERLAKQISRVDESVVAWALEGGARTQKRRGTIEGVAERLCLTHAPGAHERRYLVGALFGDAAEQDAQRRRDTVQILFEHGLLKRGSTGEDATDEEAVTDGDEGATNEGGERETRSNWEILRPALERAPSNRLRPIQAAGAYQLVALGLNALFKSALDPAMEEGRISLSSWRRAIAARAGRDFNAARAATWAARQDSPTKIANELLDASVARPWSEVGMLATELLLRLGMVDRYVDWLGEECPPIVERVLVWARGATRERAGDMIGQLLPELVEHHAQVSAKKGKGEWVVIDGDEVMKRSPRPLRLLLHSLRFAQLGQLAADLALDPEDVADET
ncbi:hypothetical protein [Polyangium spumosum]|uniref:Uncharacterized protein n=1 Tax=Polyangium spumosum TaxID=889282 RepID=A0A6N7PL83_9BACT|nr:hypothetical protein [Polyangium spumosum]MRG91586.1 hypothetical protein [Polyangium spumosum]